MLSLKKTDFIALIHKPNLPSATHIAALKQVAVDFPYFIHAKVLLAKALYQENHYEYDKYLKQVALTVPDREVLHDYLHNKKRIYEDVAVNSLQHAVANESPLMVETLLKEQSIEAEKSTPETVIPATTVATIDNTEEETALVQPEFPAQHAESTLEEIDQVTEPQEEQQPIETAVFDASPQAELPEVPPVEETPALETILPEVTEQIEAVAPNETHSFMEWLSLTQGKKTVADKPLTAPEKKPSFEEKPPQVNLPIEPVKQTVEVTKEDIERAVAKSNVNDFQNILDKFIKENPSISRPKAEFFNPVNMAKQSVEEDEELVTETLANLYYKQGNYKRAIRSYEKLCLIYPSKMTYFANLIQKIKLEIKD